MALKVGDKVKVNPGQATTASHGGVGTVKDIAERNPPEFGVDFGEGQALGWYREELLMIQEEEVEGEETPDNAALKDMTVADLRELADKEGADLTGLHLKDDIVGAVRKHRRSAARKSQTETQPEVSGEQQQ